MKVLDFGLAKLAEASAPAGDEHTRTALAAGSPTERGMIVGTASYMSPEQAEGGVVDARSDIFSFGSVLYEMATGRRAFQGSTTMSTIAAVLRDEPPPVSTITAPLPHDLEVLINRCLKKDPNRRVQHMADLKVALQELKEDSESGRLMTSVAPAPAATTPAARVADRERRLWSRIAAVAAAGWFMFGAGRAHRTSPELTRLTFDTGMTRDAGDLAGRQTRRLHVRSRARKPRTSGCSRWTGGQAVQLTHHDDGAVSADVLAGRHADRLCGASGKGRGRVRRRDDWRRAAEGRRPRGSCPRFSPDGSQLAYLGLEKRQAAG